MVRRRSAARYQMRPNGRPKPCATVCPASWIASRVLWPCQTIGRGPEMGCEPVFFDMCAMERTRSTKASISAPARPSSLIAVDARTLSGNCSHEVEAQGPWAPRPRHPDGRKTAISSRGFRHVALSARHVETIAHHLQGRANMRAPRDGEEF